MTAASGFVDRRSCVALENAGHTVRAMTRRPGTYHDAASLHAARTFAHAAAIEGRTMLVVPVPLLSPGLSSRWPALITDVDTRTGRSLIDSTTNEVIVRDDSIRGLVPFEPMGYDHAVLGARGERAAARGRGAGPVHAGLTVRRPS